MNDGELDRRKAEKKRLGEFAASFVKEGMTVGLGTGSTVAYLIEKLGKRIREEHLSFQTVATSEATEAAALRCRIPVSDLNDISSIDLTIDGVDEFDPSLNGIKGGGGALLREKMVASLSDYTIWIADSAKAVNRLGAFPLPVEVIPFGYKHTIRILSQMGCAPTCRMRDGRIYVTDGGHYILDCHMRSIDDPKALTVKLNSLPGVVENGLFIDMVDEVLLAAGNGIDVLKKKKE
ncbi:ribose-5-phosphate isomerase RpiA [Sporolactobacillus sp. THM7-7]|nr:ribose-5-phosphate isomerase RpiA [Sporolactobacillus sp. THM7-7]